MKKITSMMLLAAACLMTGTGCGSDKSNGGDGNGNKNKAVPKIFWDQQIGELTDYFWGQNFTWDSHQDPNSRIMEFYEKTRPGMVRFHNKGLVEYWVKAGKQEWDRDLIRRSFENTARARAVAHCVQVCFDDCPDFIKTDLPLTSTEQEDRTAAFFGEFAKIVKEMGYKVHAYEVFNEKDVEYQYDYPGYWRLLNKIADAIKAADPEAEVGGPAMMWANESIYKGFSDNCREKMTFFTFHSYARGPEPVDKPDEDLFTGTHSYRNSLEKYKPVISYIRQNAPGMKIILDEFNVQWLWEPYEPRHHNHVGASWALCYMKAFASAGIDGMNFWNTENYFYGLNYDSAPANVYLLSVKYLRGKLMQSFDMQDKVECLPLVRSDDKRTIVLVNRTPSVVLVGEAQSLLGGRKIAKSIRLDATTLIDGTTYLDNSTNPATYKTAEYGVQENTVIPDEIALNPYGMVILTEIAD